MALSGSFSTVINAYLTLRVAWSATQNVEANTSTITATTYFDRTSPVATGTVSKAVTISIGGNSYSGSVRTDGNGTMQLQTVSLAVGHNAEGKLSTSVGGTLAINITWGSTWIGTVSVNGNITLNDIPRATTPLLNKTSVPIGEELKITTSGRASSTFSHHIYMSVGSSGSYFVGGVTATGDQYFNWTIPDEIVPYMGNSTSMTATINMATIINPGANQTVVGWKTATFTITIPDATPYKPTISKVDVVEGVPAASFPTAFKDVFVQGISKLKVTTAAQPGKWVTISSYAVTITAGSQIQSLSGQEVTSAEVVNSGNAIASVKVTDSRGRSATKSTTVAVQPYSPPAITTLKCFRASSATGTPSDTGTWLAAQIVVSVPSVSSKNAINTLTLEYREMGTQTWAAKTIAASGTYYSGTVAYSGFSTDKRYEVRVTAVDKKSTTSVALSALPTAYFVMDFSPDGKQVAIGAAATANGLEVAMPLLMTDTARLVTKQNIFDLIWPVGKVEMTLVNTAPFYGTWQLIGAGRTLVGVDTADTDFATPNKTGGTKTQVLSAQIGAVNNGPEKLGYVLGPALADPADITYTVAGASATSTKPTNVNHGTRVFAGDTSSSPKRKDPSLVQPYLTCYIWQRTA